MKDIVITVGSANGSALALIRAIKKEVICKAYVLCTSPQTAKVIAASKFVDEVHLIIADNEKEYVNEIKRWHATKAFDEQPILYFTFDTGCYYIDNNRQWFEENFTLCLPSSDIIKTYTQKGLAESAAKNSGLTVPKTQIVETIGDIDNIVSSFSFPVIIKPRATYLKGDINFKIKVFHNMDHFKTETRSIIESGNSLLCQEFIPGGNDTAWYYLFYRDNEGYVYNSMGKKTLQSSSDGGIMLKGRSEYNKELADMCKSFLNTIDYKGIGGIEFKYHNGKYYFIEMSTRLEGFYQITENSGMPLSLISYYDLNKYSDESICLQDVLQRDGVIYLDMRGLMANRVKSLKLIKLIDELLNCIFRNNTIPNIYDATDRKPFFKHITKVG